MSTEPLEKIIQLWERGEITEQQAEVNYTPRI